MDAQAWLARWADAEARYLAERDERYRRIGALRESDSGSRVAAVGPVILEPAVEIDPEGCPVAAVRRVVGAALAAGWSVRVTRALAAVPRSGLLESFAVRAGRHGDERLWATWWNGSFNAAQYWRSGCNVEVLGFRTVARRRGVVDVIEGRQALDTSLGIH